MTNNLQVANEVTDRLSSGCDHLISSLDSGELTGAAYTAGKGLFTEIIIPSIKKLQAAIDDIQLELTSYKNADAQVSGYGDLDLDQLKELKKLREEQLAIVEAQIQARENWLNQIKDFFTLNWGKAFSEKTHYDFENRGNAHAVMIYENASRIGVQAFYLDGDKRLTTDIVYSDGTVVSGIKEVSEMTMGKPFYTDLSGRRVENPTKGVYVKSVRMADGQLKSEKVILP